MKSKEQVIRYVSRRKFSDEDWIKVLEECHKLYGSGIRKALRPKITETYDGFIEWLENGLGDGSVVDCDGDIGLLCDNGDGTYKLLAHYVCRRIVIENIQVDISKARLIDEKEFYRDLRREGYQYSVTLASIYERKLPAKYTKVAYQIGDEKGVGIIASCINKTANFLWCYGHVERRNYSVPLEDVDFFPATKDVSDRIKKLMLERNIFFNRNTLQIESMKPRAKVGEYYWFLTERFTLKRELDRHKTKDNERYECCNYFLSYAEADEFRNKLMKILKG